MHLEVLPGRSLASSRSDRFPGVPRRHITGDRGAGCAGWHPRSRSPPYQDFDISAGPLPAAGTVALPAVQTYSDGTVVRWDQPNPSGGAEPEHPAPELVVTTAAAVGAVLAVTGRRRTRMTSS